jgi:hypothetical protein
MRENCIRTDWHAFEAELESWVGAVEVECAVGIRSLCTSNGAALEVGGAVCGAVEEVGFSRWEDRWGWVSLYLIRVVLRRSCGFGEGK